MSKIRLTKKKIIGIILLFAISNIGVNIILSVPLARLDYKLISFEYAENESTSQYSVLRIKVLVRNNFWLPAKVDKILFEIYDEKTGGICGKGSIGPITLDPGQVGILKMQIKLYKNEATINFIKEFIRTQKFKGKIKALYPFTFFGLFTIARFPITISLESILQTGDAPVMQFMPGISVENISLTRETGQYAEARVRVSGVVPSEFAQVGEVKIKKASFDIINDVGHVLYFEMGPYTLDPQKGNFETDIIIRFIKGEPLQVFLEKALKEGTIDGEARGTISLEIFGIEINYAEFEGDVEPYSTILSGGNSTSETTGSIFSAVSNLLSDIISGVRTKYLGEKLIGNVIRHDFYIDITINNTLNWTLGWGNIDLVMSKNESETTEFLHVTQVGDVLVSPGESENFSLNITFYDNDYLDSFLYSLLYYGKLNSHISGSIDIYFAGVWIRDIDIKSAFNNFMGGDQGSQAGMLDQFMPIGGDFGSYMSAREFRVGDYDISLDPDGRHIVITTHVNLTYDRMPIRLSNIYGDIIYRGYYVGSIYISDINLFGNGISDIVKCSPRVEIRIDKTTPVLNDFVNDFMTSTWYNKIEFIGSVDIKFLSRYYSQVPIRLRGNMLGGDIYQLSSLSDMSDLFEIKNVSYKGEEIIGSTRAYTMEATVAIKNKYNVPIEIGYFDILVYMDETEEAFAELLVWNHVEIPPLDIREVNVEIRLYDNSALLEFLNYTLRGYTVNVSVAGNISLDLGGLNFSTDNFRMLVAASLIDSISSMFSQQSALYGSCVDIINATEYPDRIDIYVNFTQDIPLPMKIMSLKANASMNSETIDPPVYLEIVEPIIGPGTSVNTIRLTLNNLSYEFEPFVRGFVYGDLSALYVDVSIDIELFGHRFYGITLSDLVISTESTGGEESIFSALKFDGMVEIADFRYIGMTIVDGYESYAISVSIDVKNTIGISFSIWDSVLYIEKNGEKIIKIMIDGQYDIPSYASRGLNVTIYVFKGKQELGEFLEEILVDYVFNATINGTVNIKIFGIELPGYKFFSNIVMDLADQSGFTEYYDIGGLFNASIRSISVVNENENITEVNVILDAGLIRFPVKVYELSTNFSFINRPDPAISLHLNNIIDLEPSSSAEIDLDFIIYKSDMEYIREFLRRALESRLYPIDIDGYVFMEIFGVNLSLPFHFENFTATATSSQILTTATLPDVSISIADFSYMGVEYINGNKTHRFKLSLDFENIFDIGAEIGPFDIEITRDNVTVVSIYMNHFTIEPYSNTQINMSIWFYSNDYTYYFLRDLIEEELINCSFHGYGNITIFGIEILDINMTYPIVMYIKNAISGGSSSDIPLGQLEICNISIDVLNENTEYAELVIDVNTSNILKLPAKVRYMNISIYKNDNITLEGELLQDIDLSEDNVSLEFYVRLYKNNATRDLIKELVMSKVTGVSIIGELSFYFLEWNFTLSINMSNVAYSSDGTTIGDVGIPIGIDRILRIQRIEQKDERQLWVYFVFNNIVNTTIKFGEFDFAIYFYGERVVYGGMDEFYVAPPLGNTTGVFKIIFEDNDATKQFLENILINKTFEGEIRGNASFSIFGLEIMKIPFAEYVIIDLSTQITGDQSAMSNILPSVISAEVVSSKSYDDYLEINVTLTIDNAPVSISIYDLDIVFSNEYGDIGEILIDQAELSYNKYSTFNVTLRLYDKYPNDALATLIRDYVERGIVDVRINGTTSLVIFGFDIRNIPLDLRISGGMSDIQGENGGVGSIVLPMDQLFMLEEIRQITFDGDSYNLSVNVTARSPLDTLIRLGNADITIYSEGEEALHVQFGGPYSLYSYNDTIINMLLTIYDTKGAHNLLDNVFSAGHVNVSIVGYVDLYLLGAQVERLFLNLSFYQEFDTVGSISQAADSVMSNILQYSVDKIEVIGENGKYANVSVLVNIDDIPIYIKIYDMDLLIENKEGKIARLIVNETAELMPSQQSQMEIRIIVYRGTTALETFINEYIKESSTTINVNGEIEAQLFGGSSRYLSFNIPVDIVNMTYGLEDENGSLIPLDFGSMIQYKDMEYIRGYYDFEEGCNAYELKILSEFINNLNVSLALYNLSFTLTKGNETIIVGTVSNISLSKGTNTSIGVNLVIYDKVETAAFLQDLLNNYIISINVDVHVDLISIFGLNITNISLSEVFGWNISSQLEGSEVQSSVLSLFDMFIGQICVLSEDANTARLQFNITVKNARLPVYVYDMVADLMYQDARVASVVVPYIELSVHNDTSFTVNLTIYKNNKTALQGFLTDLLVKKNVVMDIWGNTTINLFGSEHLNLYVSFKYNDTVYAVDDYYNSLMSGEIDTSSFLDYIISYSAENVSWAVVSENDTHVVFRLNETLWSALNLKIYFMRTWLFMDPLNASTVFALQRLVGDLEVSANDTGEISIDIVFFKNEYLQQFLDNVLHNWEISVWADTIINLEIFGVNITGLEALSAKFAYIITLDTIQGALDSMVEEQVNSVNAEVVYLEPIGYGNWFDKNDELYGGVENSIAYAEKIWERDPAYINVWDYNWTLIKYVQQTGGFGFNVSLINFRARMVFTGIYENGSIASGNEEDFIGEIYIDNLTLVEDSNNTFFAYVRLWRVNRLRPRMPESALKDWLWSMVKLHQYNFSILNVTFSLEMWGCYIENITIDVLNFTGIYDPSSLSDVIKFNGLKSWSVGWNLNEGVYADVTFEIEVPMSPEWLTYYYMLITWDDDPIFFEDTDTCPDDPPASGGFSDNGTHKYSEVEEFKALDPASNPLAHSSNNYWIAPIMVDAPTSLPDYAVWFGTGGSYTLSARLDIEWTDGHHDYFGNIDVDQKYNDEAFTAQGKAEQENANGDAYYLLNWEGIEDGDMWVMVMFSYEVEFLMFWWVIYYYTPMFYITSGDYNPNVINGNITLSTTVYWELHDYYHVHRFIVMRDTNGTIVVKPHPNANYTVNTSVSGLYFYDSCDGAIDTSEPDYSGNYHR